MLVSAGVLTPENAFRLAPTGGWRELRELWRQTVLARRRTAGALTEWQLRRLQPAAPVVIVPPPPARRRRTRWRTLVQRVWGADPLRCPHCSGFLRRHCLVEQPEAIRAILEPLGLYEGPAALAQAPPASPAIGGVRSTWCDTLPVATGLPPPDPTLRIPLSIPLVAYDAASGEAHALETPAPRLHRAPQPPRPDPWYHRRWCIDDDHYFDFASFELPPEPPGASGTGNACPGQLALFADADVQSFPPDEEPVFAGAPGWGTSAQPQAGTPPAAALGDEAAQSPPPDGLPTLVYD